MRQKTIEPPLDHGDEWRASRKKFYENYRGKWITIDPNFDNFDIFGHVLYMRDSMGKQGPCALMQDKDGAITWTWAHGSPVAYWSF